MKGDYSILKCLTGSLGPWEIEFCSRDRKIKSGAVNWSLPAEVRSRKNVNLPSGEHRKAAWRAQDQNSQPLLGSWEMAEEQGLFRAMEVQVRALKKEASSSKPQRARTTKSERKAVLVKRWPSRNDFRGAMGQKPQWQQTGREWDEGSAGLAGDHPGRAFTGTQRREHRGGNTEEKQPVTHLCQGSWSSADLGSG